MVKEKQSIRRFKILDLRCQSLEGGGGGRADIFFFSACGGLTLNPKRVGEKSAESCSNMDMDKSTVVFFWGPPAAGLP